MRVVLCEGQLSYVLLRKGACDIFSGQLLCFPRYNMVMLMMCRGTGRHENCSAGGGHGRRPKEGGGGVEKTGSLLGPLFYVCFGETCWRQRCRKISFGLMGEIFLLFYTMYLCSKYSEYCGEFKNGWKTQKTF